MDDLVEKTMNEIFDQIHVYCGRCELDDWNFLVNADEDEIRSILKDFAKEVKKNGYK